MAFGVSGLGELRRNLLSEWLRSQFERRALFQCLHGDGGHLSLSCVFPVSMLAPSQPQSEHPDLGDLKNPLLVPLA